MEFCLRIINSINDKTVRSYKSKYCRITNRTPNPYLSEDNVPEVDPRRFIEFALRTIVATVRQYRALARASRVILDYKRKKQ